MSYAFNSFVSCPNIQERLDAGYFNADPTMFPGHINTLRAVTSPMNESGILQNQIDTKNGHYRQVEVVYQPRMTDSTTSSSATLNCAAGPEFGETSRVYNIDPNTGASRRWSIGLDDLAPRCENDESYIARQLAMHMQAIKRYINQEAVTFIGTSNGLYSADPGSTVNVARTLLTTRTKAQNVSYVYADDFMSDVIYQYQLAEAWDRPIIIGGELVQKYMTALKSHCCATVNVDLQQMMNSDAQSYFFFEPRIGAAQGNANGFAFLAPGGVQMIRYNAFRGADGIRVIDDQSIKKGTISDPETGLEFDYYAQLDCNQWKFFMGLSYKFVTLPSDVFFLNDQLRGVNYIFEGTVNN